MIGIKRRSVAAAILGVALLGVAFGSYCYRMRDCCEMTFLSNAATGATLLGCGIYSLATGKDAPRFLFLDCAVLMLSVVIMCALFAPEVCFIGTGILPHLVTPTLVLGYYLLFCDGRECSFKYVGTALVFPSAYYIFMIIFGRLTGSSVYIYFDSNLMGIGTLAALGIAAVAMLMSAAVALLYLNRFLRGMAQRARGREQETA